MVTKKDLLARASEFEFCGGELSVKRTTDGRWRILSELHAPFDTIEDAFAFGEKQERLHGYHLPVAEVFKRCRSAVRTAGWRVCKTTSDKSHVIYRPAVAITERWVGFPRGKGWSEKELRKAAAEVMGRLAYFGIVVSIVP